MDNLGPKNLVAKLVEVSASLGTIAKTGYNSFQNYTYATEADILEKIRTELSSRGIFVFSSVVNSSRDVINADKNEYLSTVLVEYTFVDSGSGETYKVNALGSGADKQDKGIYKALTGASKYMFLKNFLLPTGDDPEATTIEGKTTGASGVSGNVTDLKSSSTESSVARNRFGDRKAK